MSDIDTIREALKQAEKIIGKQPGLTSSALAAIDRLQAQQPKEVPLGAIMEAVAEGMGKADDAGEDPMSWIQLCVSRIRGISDIIDAERLPVVKLKAQQPKTLSDEEIIGEFFNKTPRPASDDVAVPPKDVATIFLWFLRDKGCLSQPNAEPVSWMHPNGSVVPVSLMGENPHDAQLGEFTIPLYAHPPASAEPRLTVEQAMEVVEPFIEAEVEMEDGARWNWESKHKKYREMIEEIRDRLTKAAKP